MTSGRPTASEASDPTTKEPTWSSAEPPNPATAAASKAASAIGPRKKLNVKISPAASAAAAMIQIAQSGTARS